MKNYPLRDSHSLVRQAFKEGVEALPFRRLLIANGNAAPLEGATMSFTTRLVMCVRGKNVMRIPRGNEVEEVSLEPGDAVLVSRKSWNQPLQSYSNRFLTLDFRTEQVRFYYRNHDISDSSQEWDCVYVMHDAVDEVMRSTLENIETLAMRDEKESGIEEFVSALLKFTCIRYPDTCVEGGSSLSSQWDEVVGYIEENMHRSISRKDVAGRLRMHPNHVSRVFRRYAKMTFVEYVNQERLTKARVLLEDHRLLVKEVAAMCGFSDPNYFSVVFKKRYGSSPRDESRGSN